MATSSSRFKFDPSLVALLGDNYRSTEDALKELVDNAWDADATRVDVTLPEPNTAEPIVIADDGTGMVPGEVEDAYLAVASSRVSRKGDLTTGNRRVKGRKGVGKFAGLAAAGVMHVETRARGKATRFRVERDALRQAKGYMEQIPIALEVSDTDGPSGTTVTLSDLNQNRSFPDPDKLRRKLVYEYGHDAAFAVYVNGERVGLSDIEGTGYEHAEEVEDAGPIHLVFQVATGKTLPRGTAGIVIKIGGKVVGEPGFFGLEDDEDIPQKLLQRLYGEVHADGIEDAVTADWGALSENSIPYQRVRALVRDRIGAALREEYKRDFSLMRARRQQEIDRRLAELPEHRREYASRALDRLLRKFYGEKPERVDPLVDVVLEAFERDEYWAVLRGVEEARHGDVEALAAALEEFGVADTAALVRQAFARRRVLDEIQELVFDGATTEATVHDVLEKNIWVFGPDYALVSSNETTRTLVRRYLDREFNGNRANKRPDLLLARNGRGRHVLIEFKRPGVPLDRKHEAQLVEYMDDLHRELGGQIQALLIGGKRSLSTDTRHDRGDIEVRTYADVLSEARDRLEWLLDGLRSG